MLSREQRQKNMDDVLTSINPDKHTFNTMLYAFADIIQGTFYNFAKSQCGSPAEVEAMEARVNQSVTDVIRVLNLNTNTNPEDMVVLSTVMLEAIEKAMIKQNEVGYKVSETVRKA